MTTDTTDPVIRKVGPREPEPEPTAAETVPIAVPTKRRTAWTVFIRKPSTIVFASILGLLVLVSLIGPLFAGDPVATNNPVLAPPSLEYPMGTDMLGRDYLPRVIGGGQISLFVGFSVALLCMTFGLVIGGLAGIFAGEPLGGLLTLFLGPLIVRVYCEVLILFFRINTTLTDIRNNTKR